jgi:polyisoprenoid-binding protein YceI
MRTLRQRAISSLAVLIAAALLAAPVAAATYQIDTTHSSVVFKVKHLGTANFYGRFNGVTGTLDFDPANPTAAKVNVEIPTQNVDTGNTQRDDHLRSPDFFDAKQFPTLSVASTKVTKVGEHHYEVAGNLTLHGVTKPVTLKVEHTGSGKHPRSGKDLIGFEARATIKRSDFGMQFMVGPLSDDVEIILAIEAPAV